MAPALGVKCFTKAYIGQNVKKIFLSEITGPRALLFGMKTSTKFVQMILLGPKMAPPSGGSNVLHIKSLYRENVNNFLV